MIALGAGELVLDHRVVAESIGEQLSFDPYLKIGWMTTSLATVAGALGAGLESDAAVREAAYGYRPERETERECEPAAAQRARTGRGIPRVAQCHRPSVVAQPVLGFAKPKTGKMETVGSRGAKSRGHPARPFRFSGLDRRRLRTSVRTPPERRSQVGRKRASRGTGVRLRSTSPPA